MVGLWKGEDEIEAIDYIIGSGFAGLEQARVGEGFPCPPCPCSPTVYDTSRDSGLREA
jgi:hypothetical protein